MEGKSTDQAAVLRQLVQRSGHAGQIRPARPCELVSVTSGKGGVGKTNVVVNLAIALSRAGRRVAILDADFGLANVDVFLGLTPQFHLGHVIEGICRLEEIIIEGPEGIGIIPASSGIQELTEMGEIKRGRLIRELDSVMKNYDFFLIDTAAGISNNVIQFLVLSPRVIVVCAPEPTAIVDAYALIKVLMKRDAGIEILLLVNSADSEREALSVHRQLDSVASRFLGRKIHLLGFIPRDLKVSQSVRRQMPLLISHPRTLVSRCFVRVAQTLLNRQSSPARLGKAWEKTIS